MDGDCDVLIVGAGPTGLMLACQLARFGISFKIIDKGIEKAKESRAIGIQAKSMEIFQNLGIAAKFLESSLIAKSARLYFNTKLKVQLDFQKITLDTTPYPHLFLLPQAETEQILIDTIEKQGHSIERQKELLTFTQTPLGVVADIKNHVTGQYESISCRYIVGCDGAKSRVREVLDIPFVGGSYNQEFVLADVAAEGPFENDCFALYVNKSAILVHIPLKEDYCRLIMSGIKGIHAHSQKPPTSSEIEAFAKEVMGISFKLQQPLWSSVFHLHHRAVLQYQKGRAFLAGDAAHIHSPVGGQGMNTGLQDATNLAWKIAATLKYGSPQALIDTYQVERQRVGKNLLRTTDRIFGLMTSKNPFVAFLRQWVVPNIAHLLMKSKKFQQKVFYLMSQLAIAYPENDYVVEVTRDADAHFLKGPKAGARAPDAPIFKVSTLFELFQAKPCHILIFEVKGKLDDTDENAIKEIAGIDPNFIAVHRFELAEGTKLLFECYGVTSNAIYFIRPDGYIGFRACGCQFAALRKYLYNLFSLWP